jgi:hypothetical protein
MTMPATRTVSSSSDADLKVLRWARDIGAAWDAFEAAMTPAFAATLALGDQLLAAKKALKHGEFCRLFRDHASPVKGALSFTRNWAARLMSIARSPIVRKHGAALPVAIASLYALTRVPGDEIDDAVESGVVHKGMSVREAVGYQQKVAPSDRRKRATNVDDVLLKLARDVQRPVRTLLARHPDLRQLVLERAAGAIAALHTEDGGAAC